MRTQENLDDAYKARVEYVGREIANAFTGSGKYKLVYGPMVGTSNCLPGWAIPGKHDVKFMEDLRVFLDKELESAKWSYRVTKIVPGNLWRTAYVVIG